MLTSSLKPTVVDSNRSMVRSRRNKGGFAMAIQDEVSIIETVTTDGSQIGFAAAPRIHQTEVAKLIESVHGPGTSNTFLHDVHCEGRSYIDLESGVQISG